MKRILLSIVFSALPAVLFAQREEETPKCCSYVVTTTAYSGKGSLTAALDWINNSCDATCYQIVFNIRESVPKSGYYTIQEGPEGSIWQLRVSNVTIDGATQTAFTGDTNPYGPEVMIPGRFDILSSDNQVRNLCFYDVLLVETASASRNVIAGNYIGLEATGTSASPWSCSPYCESGLRVSGFASDNTVGGEAIADRNLISHLEIFQAGRTRVLGNYIGTDRTGTAGAAGAVGGIVINWDGPAEIRKNVIAFGLAAGISVNVQGILIRENSIHSNGGLGIDLGSDGVTANDVDDTDSGANGLQNFPLLYSASKTMTSTTVSGELKSLPGRTYIIDLYDNDSPDPTWYGEGQRHVGSIEVTTNWYGWTSFAITVNELLTYITATATDVEAGASSEFSYVLIAPPGPY